MTITGFTPAVKKGGYCDKVTPLLMVMSDVREAAAPICPLFCGVKQVYCGPRIAMFGPRLRPAPWAEPAALPGRPARNPVKVGGTGTAVWAAGLLHSLTWVEHLGQKLLLRSAFLNQGGH